MINKLFQNLLRKELFCLKRSLTRRCEFQLGYQMKLLNDKHDYNGALELFDKYKINNIETCSSMIITQALKASTKIGDFQRGSIIHQLLRSHVNNDSYISASLINFYMHFGDTTKAQSLFDMSKSKTLVMYGALMKGFIKNNMANKAIDLFNEIKNPDDVIFIILFNACAQLRNDDGLKMINSVYKKFPKSFHSNHRVVTSLFDALIKCGDTSSAKILFSKMKKNIISYGNLMNGFNQEKNYGMTLNLFNQMKHDGIEGNSIIYLCLMKALSELGDYSIAQDKIQQMPKSFLLDRHIQNALIDLWGKTANVDKAKQIFDKMCKPDKIAYTAMINSYGLNGMGIYAIKLFRQIPIDLIDESAYVCVLNACSHSGLINDARSIFENIQVKTGKIYTAMVDCLSRGCFFEEAQQLINEFERQNSPIWPMHMALLSGARNEKNTDLAQIVYDRMKERFPQLNDPLLSAAILLANVYASSDDIEKAFDIKVQTEKTDANTKIGFSWTVVNGQYFQFQAHDRSHPRSTEIYNEIDKISKELISYGHEFDSSWITQSLSSNGTVASVLCGHSERLAIAWNFVENPNVSSIQVTKNLRVCGDCHRVTKLIATIRQCEITVRDANRIHHFYKNGKCSCNDYF